MNKDGKLMIWLKGKWIKIKSWAPFLAFCTTAGIIIGGSTTAMVDTKRVDKLEKRMDQAVNAANHNVEAYDQCIDEMRQQIDELTRQNNTLLEKALKETEGKAS